MNIIEKRRRKAWAHATMVIMNKVIREASTGTIFIYGETLYGKDYFLTPDDALDAVLSRMTGRSVRAIQVMRHKMRKNGEVRTDE